MRNPNGYGCIKKLNGNRRRPFVFVMSQEGRQKAVAYFATAQEAALYQADYFRSHHGHDLPGHQITFMELYRRWLPVYLAHHEVSVSSCTSYANAYRHCQSLWYKSYTSIKYEQYQAVIDGMLEDGLSYSSVKKVRSLISLLAKYAIKIELAITNYAPLLDIGKNRPVHPHHVFSRQKINRLWSCVDYPGVDSVLILLYTGMRCSELLNLSKSDVNLRQHYLRITKSKTRSGLRVIPIHPRILPLIQHRMQLSGTLLLADPDGRPYNYSRYTTIWDNVMKRIHAKGHTTHDCRHTVATLLDNANANENAKRRILGHADGNITDRVYTHKGLRQLRKAIQLLK